MFGLNTDITISQDLFYNEDTIKEASETTLETTTETTVTASSMPTEGSTAETVETITETEASITNIEITADVDTTETTFEKITEPESTAEGTIITNAPTFPPTSVSAPTTDPAVNSEGYIIPTIPEDEDKKYKGTRVLDPEKPVIAITFDDGPSAYTEAIIDKLVECGGASTFFEVGMFVNRRKTVLKKIIESGSEIGNHTWDHTSFKKLTPEQIDKEIGDTQDAIFAVTGKYPTLVRPPYGIMTDEANAAVKFPLILWSVDTRDWKLKDAEKVAAYVMETAADGEIVLLHDSHRTTMEAALIFIPKLIEEGFQLVTVTELFEFKQREAEISKAYVKAKAPIR